MAINIRRPLKKFAKLFAEAREGDLNEADTVLRLCRFFEEVLGYDGLTDISREAEMKRKYVDICLKIDGRVRILVEAKAAGVKLRDRHIEQAQAYASQNNYRWVILTNGTNWHLYHLTFEEGIEYETAFAVSLTTDSELDEALPKLSVLHKQAVGKGALETFWEKATALGPASIGAALFSEPVLTLIRRELRRSAGVLIDPEDLAKSLQSILTLEAREQIGPVRIRKRRKPQRRGKMAGTSGRSETEVANSEQSETDGKSDDVRRAGAS
jgi:hypothetical protein